MPARLPADDGRSGFKSGERTQIGRASPQPNRSEVFFREGSAGGGLEVAFEVGGAGGVVEGQGGLDGPGAEVGGVGGAAFVVFGEAGAEVVG